MHRINSFKNEAVMGKNNAMKIKKYSWKGEFQERGAGHIHGTLWCNLRELANHSGKSDNAEADSEISTLEKTL